MNLEKEILPDNPAVRLQTVLEKMIDTQFQDKEKVSAVLSRIFDVNHEPAAIFPHYSQLFVLIQGAYETVIHYYPKQQRTHAAWRQHLSQSLQNHSLYHHEWKALISAIQQGSHLDMVQVASDNLSHYVKPTEVQGLTLDELEQQISLLVEEIEASDELSEYLKLFLKEELQKILSGIKYFDLYGSEPIKKSIYSILANSEVSKKFGSKVVKGVGTLLVIVATSIGVVNDVNDLPSSLENLRNEFLLPQVDAVEMQKKPTDEYENVIQQSV